MTELMMDKSNASNPPSLWDRTSYVPRHTGPNVLPNTPMLSQLLRHAYHGRLAIRDLNLGVQKTYADLLSDVLYLRNIVEARLSPDIKKALENGEEVYMGVLAAGGYEYAVGVLTVMALKAAIVPMSVVLPVEEASYFVKTSQQVMILYSSAAKPLGISLEQFINQQAATPIQTVEIGPHLSQTSFTPREIIISSDHFLNDNSAGLIIFTSGTTGPPKGAVWSRGVISEAARSVMDHYALNSQDVILHVLPVHHATGITMTLSPFLMAGACIEFRSGGFSAEWMWNRWREGGLTYFSGVPTIYMRMMRFFVQQIQPLPKATVEEYAKGANQFRGMLCGTSALPAPVQEFWTRLRHGKAMLTRYGGTEFGAVFKVPLGDQSIPLGSVGRLVPGMDAKLSNGNEGEVLVKSPVMFSKSVAFSPGYDITLMLLDRYVFDVEATVNAHDEEGYFKTGDIARREGDNYFIMGRASVDIIKSGGYKISALDIERECLGLPYVEEVMCVGVEDDEFGQRVAAAVKLREDQDIYSCQSNQEGRQLTINDLRRDLRGKLAGYKLPTLLRVLQDELPKTASGKVQKKLLGPQLFPCPGWESVKEVQAWRNPKLEVMAKL